MTDRQVLLTQTDNSQERSMVGYGRDCPNPPTQEIKHREPSELTPPKNTLVYSTLHLSPEEGLILNIIPLFP